MNGLTFSPLVFLNKTLNWNRGVRYGGVGWLAIINVTDRSFLTPDVTKSPNWLLEEEQRFRRIFSVPGCNQIGRWIKLRISFPTFGSGDFRLGGGRSYHLGSRTHSWHGFESQGNGLERWLLGWLVGWLGFRAAGTLESQGVLWTLTIYLVLYFVMCIHIHISPKLMEVEHVSLFER